jgi:integrase
MGPSTRQVERRAFRSFFAFATGAELIDSNLGLGLKPIKSPMPSVRTPGQAERPALVGACPSLRDAAIIYGLFGTGLRRGELSAIRISEVNLPARIIQVPKSKSGKPRTAVIDERARNAFALWLDDRNHQKPGHDWLRTTDSGDRLGPDGVRMVIRRVSDRSGVKFSSHDARRSGSVAIVLKMSSNRPNNQVSRCSSMSVARQRSVTRPRRKPFSWPVDVSTEVVLTTHLPRLRGPRPRRPRRYSAPPHGFDESSRPAGTAPRRKCCQFGA